MQKIKILLVHTKTLVDTYKLKTQLKQRRFLNSRDMDLHTNSKRTERKSGTMAFKL